VSPRNGLVGVADSGVDDVIVVMGDFHLSSGSDPSSSGPDPLETFHDDEAFSRLLDSLCDRFRVDERPRRLVMLGDLFDFPRVRLREPTRMPGEASTVARLDRIAGGHAVFFAALAKLLAAGWQLDIVPGNHDTELMRSSVQERLRTLLTNAGAGSVGARTLRVHPWILYVPGVLYAEHGQQYHDINSFPALLRCATAPSTHDDRPIGARFDDYLLDLVQATNHDLGLAAAPLSHVRRSFRRRPDLALRTSPLHLRFLTALLRETVVVSPRRRAGRREEYRQRFFPNFATEIGLSYEILCAIDALAETTAAGLRARVARALVVQPIVAGWGRLGGRGTDEPISAGLGFPSSAAQRSMHLRAIATAIHRILVTDGQGVPFYVFGHTHRAECVPLVVRGGSPYCLNGGSWTVSDWTSPGGCVARRPFTFVEICRDAAQGNLRAQLRAWDDDAGRPETIAPIAMDEDILAAR
jgi:UDP-2,3-diacylglucosamine pyrophosphatase LpxH